MSEFDPAVPRRTVLKSAGLGVSAGLLSSLPVATQASPGGEIWSAEYWAKKGDVKLNLWRKRIGAPKSGERRCPLCFWCMAPRTRRVLPTISLCRARVNTR